MTIRIKAFILIGGVLVAIVLVLVGVSQRLLMRNSEDVEAWLVRRDVGRAVDILDSERRCLEYTAAGWAAKRDPRAEIASLENAGASVAAGMPVADMVAVTGTNGVVLAGRLLDRTNGTYAAFSTGIDHLSSLAQSFMGRLAATGAASGLVIVSDLGPVLVAMRPYALAEGEDRPAGICIAGRVLDGFGIARLGGGKDFEMHVCPLRGSETCDGCRDATLDIAGGAVAVKPGKGGIVAGYVRLSDINGKPAAILRIAMGREIYSRSAVSVRYITWLLVFSGLMLLIVILWLVDVSILSAMTSSVANLREGVRSIGKAAKLSERIDVGEGGGEVGRLADEINDMLRALETAQKEAEQNRREIVQTQKLASLGMLVSGLAHEVNNPNNVIMLNAKLFEEFYDKIRAVLDEYAAKNPDFRLGGRRYAELRDDLPKLLGGIQESSRRINGLVNDLKSFARQDSGELTEKVDLNAVVESAARLLKHDLGAATSNLTISCAPNLPPVTGNFQRLEQVLVNLLQNACQALTDRSQEIAVTTEFHEADKAVNVLVRDGGKGIQHDVLPKITSPFFTTRRDEGGMGLGLSLSSRIVHEHRGSLKFFSTPGIGTTVVLTLPAAAR